MSELTNLIAELSPEQRELFLTQLNELYQNSPVSKQQTIPRRAISGPLPLSFAQERMWFLDQLIPNNPAYNLHYAYRLSGPLNVGLLELCLNEITRRHEVLRTTFPAVNGQPSQMITSTVTLTLPLLDLQEYPEFKREDQARQLVVQEVRRPFKLAQAPPWRAVLLRLSQEDHFFVLVVHHIIIDLWSERVLFQEIAALYKAFSTGKPSPLPELPIQYADFTLWQREWLQGERLESLVAYWKTQLRNSPPVLELPTDRPRPPVQTFLRAGVKNFGFGLDLSQRLKYLGEEVGMTLYMVLMAVFSVLLSRYSGKNDIVIGSPLANRNWGEIEPLIGFFANALPFRFNLSGNVTFKDYLKQVRTMALGVYTHQDLPFERVVEALQPERSLSHHPIYQVTFEFPVDFQDALVYDVDLENLAVTPLIVDVGTVPFDMEVWVSEIPTGLDGEIAFNRDLFDEVTIDRLIRHFQILLQDIAENPQKPISQLALLPSEERRQLLEVFNATELAYPEDQCIHHLFEAQVARIPEAIALRFEQQQLTYAALNQKANRLARYLQKLGLGPEMLVGVCLERSLEMIVGLMGILKAGAAYVPIDPHYPAERIGYILENAQIEAVLTQSSLAEMFNHEAIHVISLDRDWPEISGESAENLNCQLSPSNMAYVIYTSGSTGRPKGTAIEHRGIVNYLTWGVREYLGPENKKTENGSFVYLPFSFDASVTSLFAPLMSGKSVVISSKDALEIFNDPWVQRGGFDFIKVTPAHLPLLKACLNKEQLKKLTKTAIIGGEALLSEHLDFLRELEVDWRIINEYGPTETVVGSTTFDYSSLESRSGPIPIGRAIMNARIYILDPWDDPTPMGVPGEICIGGVGVGRGYLRNPALTAEKFQPDPFLSQGSGRLYRTGDLGRWRPDGTIEFLGRRDQQIKIRGYRIELGEIEAVLVEHPHILEAAVVAIEEAGDRLLAAYLVPQQNGSINLDALADFLKDKLPNYMIPARFYRLDQQILTPNGKIDRDALTQLGERITGQKEYTAPRSELEARLTQTWQELLVLDRVGIDDNFFELGGHSLLGVELISKINSTYSQTLPITTLFEKKTIRGLASLLESGVYSANSASTSENERVMLIKKGMDRTKHCFFVHDGSGQIDSYLNLAEVILPQFYCWGIKADLHSILNLPSLTIEHLAGDYIAEVKKIQAKGPVYIIGGCTGGAIAFEMARQLEAQDRPVGGCFLINAPAPQTGIEDVPEADEVTHHLRCAGKRYIPPHSIQTQLHYFRPHHSPSNEERWQKFCVQQVVLHRVEGDPVTIFQLPYVQQVGREINQGLDSHPVFCKECALPSCYPNIVLDENDTCNYCHNHVEIHSREQQILSEEELQFSLKKYKQLNRSYDVLIPLSGGVDSSAALINVVEKFQLKVLGWHNDHGYEDPTATENVKKLCRAMNVDLIIQQHDLQFMKKLWKYTCTSEVKGLSGCFICGGILYANALNIADKFNIPLVINGYSKGQAEMLSDKTQALESWRDLLEIFKKDSEFYDAFMKRQEPLTKQKIFLSKSDLAEIDPARILVIPFYIFNFYKSNKDTLRQLCRSRFDWQPIQSTYPGRTTNCTMVWLTTYFDLKKMNYSMYHQEYATLVRKGEISRQQAFDDLHFNPPPGLISHLADEIGIKMDDNEFSDSEMS